MADSWLPGVASLDLDLGPELQQLLTDEHLRSEQHKLNYRQLKAEHGRLQDEYVTTQNELKASVDESRALQEHYQKLIDSGKRALAEKVAELQDAQSKILSPSQMEMLKLEIMDESLQPYKERISRLESELEIATKNCNKLRYDLSFVTAEFENERRERGQVTKELKLQHEVEVTNLRKERDNVVIKVQEEGVLDAQKLRAVQHENMQLTLRNKSIIEELEELRSLREKASVETDQIQRAHDKHMAEQSASIKVLESEKDMLKKQAEEFRKQIQTSSNCQSGLTSRIHELEKENGILKSTVNEMKHKGAVEISNVKMEFLKQKGDVERERDALRNMLADYKSKMEVAEHKSAQLDFLLSQKDKECVKRVHDAREEEWVKVAALENEKLELQTKVQELSRNRLDEESHMTKQRERWEEKIKLANNSRVSAERELTKYKSQLEILEKVQSDTEDDRLRCSQLRVRSAELEAEVRAAREAEHEMVDTMMRIKNQNLVLNDEIRITKQQMDKFRDNMARAIDLEKSDLSKENSKLNLQVKDLHKSLNEWRNKAAKVVKKHKKFKSKYDTVNHSLVDKIQLLKAKIEESKIENKALKQFVPPEEFNQVKKQLRDLQKRHAEFRTIIYSRENPQTFTSKNLSIVSPSKRFRHTLNNCMSLNDTEHDMDILQLRRRLDILDSFQQQQLLKLRNIGDNCGNNSANNATFTPDLGRKFDSTSPVISDKHYSPPRFRSRSLSSSNKSLEKYDAEKPVESQPPQMLDHGNNIDCMLHLDQQFLVQQDQDIAFDRLHSSTPVDDDRVGGHPANGHKQDIKHASSQEDVQNLDEIEKNSERLLVQEISTEKQCKQSADHCLSYIPSNFEPDIQLSKNQIIETGDLDKSIDRTTNLDKTFNISKDENGFKMPVADIPPTSAVMYVVDCTAAETAEVREISRTETRDKHEMSTDVNNVCVKLPGGDTENRKQLDDDRSNSTTTEVVEEIDNDADYSPQFDESASDDDPW